MLSDEEKEAIDFFEKSFKKKIPPYWYDDTISNIEEKIKVILNLIEKQSKEIEKLKENNGYHLGFIDGGIVKKYEYQDKIQAKIEEIEKRRLQDGECELALHGFQREAKIEVLQSLLEKE